MKGGASLGQFLGRWGGSVESVWFLPHLQKDPLLPLMPVANSDFCMLVLQSSANPQELDLVSTFSFFLFEGSE